MWFGFVIAAEQAQGFFEPEMVSRRWTERSQDAVDTTRSAPVHLHDLLDDGQPEARAALGLGKKLSTWWNCSKMGV